ncbi:MAG TPA: hypothetical protein VFG32_05700 [Bacteroidota bacterium]|nr:hypothetical protein [Bacteroidota bacterium]
MPSIELAFTTSVVTVLLLLLLAAGIAWFFYRYTLPPVAPGKRLLLTFLRTASLFLLLALLFEPLLRLVFTSTQPPVLAVLVDNSKSMGITDKAGSRKEQLLATLGNSALKQVGTKGDLAFYLFGAGLRSSGVPTADTITTVEDATDISSALTQLGDEKDRLNIHSVLLLTDGAYNLGQNPLYAAEQLLLPIYAVGIGDSSEQKDVLISKVVTNELVYNETTVPVNVTIRSSGYNGERVEVTLREGEKEVSRSTVTLREGTREYQTQLSYVPTGEGTKKYTVRVSSLPQELTANNNQRSFFAKVMKSKVRVVMIASAPGSDVAVLRQTLVEEKNIQVRSFVQKGQTGWYEASVTPAVVDSADCLLLVNFPSSTTSPATMDLVRQAVIQNHTPMLFVAGRNVDDAMLRTLGPALPFTTVSLSPVEQYMFFKPADAQKSNPILGGTGPDVWSRMPPLFKTQSTYKAKPEATILGYTQIQTVALSEPFMLTRNVNRQKSLAVLAYGLWRWRLMAQGNPETSQLLSTFLANSIRWLTTRDDSRPVKVTTTKDAYTQGEPVEVVGQVYDANAQPVDNAEMRVRVQQGTNEFETTLRPLGSGRYEGAIDGLGEGDYTFRATAQTGGQPLGEDRGRFSVGELNLEFQDTRMNAGLLRQLAHRTGGEFFAPDQISELPPKLSAQPSFAPRDVVHTRAFELWNWRYTLALIVLLLGLEWFLRKRSGML